MAKFFNFYPTTVYTNSNESTSYDIVTNIIARFAFEKSLKENSALFYSYDIQEGDTPEIIANKYYGSPEKHWIVLLFNDIVDPQYDWPLTDRNLIVYINDKYSANGAASNPTKSGIAWAQSNIKTYYKIVTRVNSNPTKDTIVEKIEVDANTYANVSVTTATYILQDTNRITESITKQPLYYYDYETEVNEGKRKITLLKDTFVTGTGATLMDEFKRIITLGE
jgi:hypothetical protein